MYLYQLVGNFLWIDSDKCCSNVELNLITAVTNNQFRAIGSKKPCWGNYYTPGRGKIVPRNVNNVNNVNNCLATYEGPTL